MRQLHKWTVLVALLATAAAGIGFASGADQVVAGTQETILCPKTGEEIAKDDCPLVDSERADCPGKIECPLTGELVCRDRCPLDTAADAAEASSVTPDCCGAE